jgi:hypothetical protein
MGDGGARKFRAKVEITGRLNVLLGDAALPNGLRVVRPKTIAGRIY